MGSPLPLSDALFQELLGRRVCRNQRICRW